jgi:hypothetical protein
MKTQLWYNHRYELLHIIYPKNKTAWFHNYDLIQWYWVNYNLIIYDDPQSGYELIDEWEE